MVEQASDPQVPAQAAALQVPKPATLSECHQVIDTLSGELAALREAVALLSERLALNSRNSSKPPSSDGPGSGGNRAQRRASQRKRGAQKGHPGAWRELLPESQVDSVQPCVPPDVCDCGGVVGVRGAPRRHQVFDLPAQIRPVVSEYQLYTGICAGCGKAHGAALPAGVPSGQIGPRALALLGVLGTRFQMPQMKIRDLLAQLMGLDFSIGAISQAHGKVAQALAEPVQAAAATVSKAPLVHLDETHYPCEGRSSGHWVWACVQPQLALYSLLPSRARYVLTSLIGERPAGVVVSDRYSAYAHLEAGHRQVCWAHLLRDFNRIAQRAGEAGRIGRRLLGLGHVLFRWCARRRKGRPVEFERLRRRVHLALQRGAALAQCSRTANTCANLLKLGEALWTFSREPGVPPTNNAAEQALRAIVLKRKISGPTRSRRGANFIAWGFSVAESCRRQGRDLLDYMQQSVFAWINGSPAPSLTPATVQAAPSG